MTMCKAFSLENLSKPLRRALPYAVMCKASGLENFTAEGRTRNSVGRSPTWRLVRFFSPVRAVAGRNSAGRPYRATHFRASLRRAPPYAISPCPFRERV